MNKSRQSKARARRKILWRAVSVLMGLAVAAVIGEIALRVTGIGFPILYRPDDFCGTRLQASIHGVWCDEGHGRIHINSLGFRGPEIKLNKPPDTVRIAVLGDSFIEALQVDYEESFCAQLQNRLTKSDGIPARSFEVINCGVSGFGTAQELLMLKHHVFPLMPDAVLLCVYPDNDIWNNSKSLSREDSRPFFELDENNELIFDTSFRQSAAWLIASTAREHWKRSFVNKSRMLQVLNRARLEFARNQQDTKQSNTFDELQAMIQATEYVYKPPQTRDHQAGWKITERLIGEISDECHRRAIECWVFTASSPAQVHPSKTVRERLTAKYSLETLLYPDQRLADFCSIRNIRFLPLASQLQAEVEHNQAYLHGFGRLLGFGHWNETGHAAAARLVAESLALHGVFVRRS